MRAAHLRRAAMTVMKVHTWLNPSGAEAAQRAALDALPLPAVVYSAVRDDSGAIVDFLIVHVNDAACASSGTPRERQVGRTLRALVPGSVDSGLFAAYREVAETGRPLVRCRFDLGEGSGGIAGTRLDGVCAGRHGDGVIATWSGADPAGALRRSEERPADARRVDAALRESEQRLRIAASAAGLGVFEWDVAADRAVWENERMYEIFGRARAEGALSKAQFLEILHPDDAAGFERDLADAMRPGRRFRAACRFRRMSDGAQRWIEFAGEFVFDAQGAPHKLVGVAADITEREQAERRLQVAHDAFRHVVDNSPFGVYAVDADFRLTQVSVGAQKVFANVRPLLGRDFAEVLRTVWPEPFATQALAMFRRTLDTGEPYHAPATTEQRRDVGDVEAYDWRIKRVTMPDGRFGVVCHFYDLSERRRLEAALRESEQRFKSMADTAPAMLWVTDARGSATFLSRGWLEHTGQTETEALGRGWLEAVHPGDREAAAAVFSDAVSARQPFALDYRLRRADGAYRWAVDSGKPRFGAAGEFLGFIGSVIDIHERRAVEDALRESEHRFRLAKEAALLGIHDYDVETGAIHWDERVREIWGVGADAHVDYALFESGVHPDDRSRVGAAIQAAFDPAGDGRFLCDYRVVSRRDGLARWLCATGRVTFEGARPIRLVGTVQDITEQRSAEEELRAHRERLEHLVAERTAELESSLRQLSMAERMAALGTLSAGLGHDMGNILMPMRMSLGELERMRLPEDAREHLGLLWGSIDYLRTLASGLRLLSMDPEHDAAPRGASLDAWWPEVAGVCRAALPAWVTLTAHGFDAVPDVAPPGHALMQIVFNLIQNAGDALRDRRDGSIRLEASRHAASGRVRLTVRDDGPGMPPDVLARCMEPFFTTKARSRGTGLGLAIVYRLARRFDIGVEIESAPGKGTAFSLLLPAAAPRTRPAVRAAVAMSDPRIGALASTLLTSRGVAVETPDAPPAHAALWIVDGSIAAERISDFLGADPARLVIRIGESREASGRILPVAEPRPTLLRDAIARAVAMLEREA